MRTAPICRLALLALLAAACGRPPAAPPAPVRDTAAERRDSLARAARRADSLAREAELARERARREAATLRICAGGDVALGTNLDTGWTAIVAKRLKRKVTALPSADSLLRPLRPLVRDADVVLLNIESAIGDGPPAFEKCAEDATGCYALRMPARAAPAIRRLHPEAVIVGNLANNHARDAGSEGLDESVRHLRRAGVVVTGIDTMATVVTGPGGDTVAFLGFATSGGALDVRNLEEVRRHVARAAALHRRLIVTMHMGAEGAGALRTRDTVETYYDASRGNPVAFARTATEAGAHLVIGHGPHVMRAVEWRGDALVFYSLGNLLTYGPFSHREPMRRGAVACATVDGKGRITDAVLRPTSQRPPGLLSSDRARRALTIADSLSRLDFPLTGARIARDGTIRRR